MKMKIMLFLFILLIGIVGLIVLLRSYNPVIYTFTETGTVGGGPHFVIWNPFRDRGPENIAQIFLEHFRKDCKDALRNLEDPTSYYVSICENEARYKLQDWKLKDRRDGEGNSRLFYNLLRNSDDTYYGEMRITIEKSNNQWEVTDLEVMY